MERKILKLHVHLLNGHPPFRAVGYDDLCQNRGTRSGQGRYLSGISLSTSGLQLVSYIKKEDCCKNYKYSPTVLNCIYQSPSPSVKLGG
jgi:hypothetical protein